MVAAFVCPVAFLTLYLPEYRGMEFRAPLSTYAGGCGSSNLLGAERLHTVTYIDGQFSFNVDLTARLGPHSSARQTARDQISVKTSMLSRPQRAEGV